MTVIGALLPVVVTLLMGVVAAWHHDFDAKEATVLNRMVMMYALPMLLFAGMVAIPRDQLTGDVRLFAVIVITMVMGFIVPFLIARFLFSREPILRSLSGLAGRHLADHATDARSGREAVRRLCRRHATGIRYRDRDGAVRPHLRRGAGRIQLLISP